MFRRLVMSLLIILCYYHPLFSIKTSIVYNMRVSTITKALRFNNSKQNVFIELPFGQWRKYSDGDKQDDYGLMNSYIYQRPPYYIKIDGAFAWIRSRKKTSTVARTQTDDLLFSSGYCHKFGDKGSITASGILGIPTHRDYSLEGIQFGTGNVGLGAQLDGSYRYGNNKNIIFPAFRYIYFIPRNAQQKTTAVDPYPCNQYKIKLGSLIDIFISYMRVWNDVNKFEVGYSPTFNVGDSVEPFIDHFSATEETIRQSFFGVYERAFNIKKMKNNIVIALSGGFYNTPKDHRALYHLTSWLAWSLFF